MFKYQLFLSKKSQDKRTFLAPWILVMFLHILLEIAHFIYLLVIDTVSEIPLIPMEMPIKIFNYNFDLFCFT